MEKTIVRKNLMKDVNYRPYCGNLKNSRELGGCSSPRTFWSKGKSQFVCVQCGWESKFPEEFIRRYKRKHDL